MKIYRKYREIYKKKKEESAAAESLCKLSIRSLNLNIQLLFLQLLVEQLSHIITFMK